ncbi:unnamed protein product [Caenorhabditis angaria]|uniref:Innexin n=1 Tax=Caenorhabditis angaria TaxID=860376 RepID=A0A9P1I5X9_9PELO|nr:unnamed protein product [Caenorhabditis angaria]
MPTKFPIIGEDITLDFNPDAVDKLRFFGTPIFLVACGFFIMTKQYVGQSVQCWVPTHFKDSWEAYAETYCLVENTYFVPMNQSNLPEIDTRENREMKYYQWVPFILFGMAFALYIPKFVYQISQLIMGIDLSLITIYMRNRSINGLSSNDSKTLEELRNDIKITAKRRGGSGETWGFHLTLCLIIRKVTAAIIVFASIIFLESFMGLGPMYGYTVTRDLLAGREWKESGSFPRVTFCDFEVREIGYINNWTLQCVLMVNMFNEKLFVALWWLYLILAILSMFDIARIIYRFTAYHQINFVYNILNNGGNVNAEKTEISRFIRSTLKNDGITLLHLINSNFTIFETADFLLPKWNSRKTKNE